MLLSMVIYSCWKLLYFDVFFLAVFFFSIMGNKRATLRVFALTESLLSECLTNPRQHLDKTDLIDLSNRSDQSAWQRCNART